MICALCWCALSCARGEPARAPREAIAPPPEPQPLATPEVPPAPIPEPNRETPPETPTEPAPTPPPERTELRFTDHYAPEAAVSLLAWKREHGATGPSFDQICWPQDQVGVPAAPGLLCIAANPSPEFKLARVYRLEGTRLREVWQAIVATYANWLELTPLLSDDGATLTLHDRKPYSCERAIHEYRAKVSARVAPPSGELLEPACAKRGQYAYERGSFRFVPGTAPKQALPYF